MADLTDYLAPISATSLVALMSYLLSTGDVSKEMEEILKKLPDKCNSSDELQGYLGVVGKIEKHSKLFGRIPIITKGMQKANTSTKQRD